MKYTSFRYLFKAQQAPGLIVTHEPQLNYSNPISYEIEYLQMCLIFNYQTAYESAQKYDLGTNAALIGIQVAQTSIGVLAGYGGFAATARFVPKVVNKLANRFKFFNKYTSEFTEIMGWFDGEI